MQVSARTNIIEFEVLYLGLDKVTVKTKSTSPANTANFNFWDGLSHSAPNLSPHISQIDFKEILIHYMQELSLYVISRPRVTFKFTRHLKIR